MGSNVFVAFPSSSLRPNMKGPGDGAAGHGWGPRVSTETILLTEGGVRRSPGPRPAAGRRPVPRVPCVSCDSHPRLIPLALDGDGSPALGAVQRDGDAAVHLEIALTVPGQATTEHREGHQAPGQRGERTYRNLFNLLRYLSLRRDDSVGTCPNCHASGFLFVLEPCRTCGRQGCKNCLSTFGVRALATGTGEPWKTCSPACFDNWAAHYVSTGADVSAWGPNWVFEGLVLGPDYLARVRYFIADHKRKWALANAVNMLNAERHEDAARIYESLGMYREAGEARRAGKRQITTQVHVDVNNLIEQIRKAGISTDYACPVCGGHIRIAPDTPIAKLTSCEFCGSVIQTTDLVDFLTKVVGYR